MQFDWNPKKNALLKVERDISFETIMLHIARGDVWRVADHPNQKQYPGQRILFVIVDDYVYMVPYIQEGDKLFLKTIIPNRKATRDYHAEKNDT